MPAAGRTTALTGVAYALLVLAMWGLFTFSSGMWAETAFAYRSEVVSVWSGFFERNDSLRIHTNTFYQLSYLLAEALRIPGSFATYQIVYAALWWARGFLVYLILRRLLSGCALFCYTIGALVLVHASDGALQWVGQLNQFGFILWMLLAIYVLVAGNSSAGAGRTLFYILLAGFFEYMSLWSYESQLFIILAVPPLVWLSNRPAPKRRLIVFAAWYGVPLVYIFLSAARYLHSSQQTYQASVLRKSWTPPALLNDLLFNTWASLSVWSWNRIYSDVPRWQVLLLAAIAAAAFIVVGAILSSRRFQDRPPSLPAFPAAVRILAAGTLLLLLSFPVYLLLESARGLWRTQILSGIGAALVLASIVSLAAALIRPEPFRRAVFLGLTATIVFVGSYSAIERGGAHRMRWRNHRHAMAEVISAAPQVKPGTIFVLVDVPGKSDPFRISQWFDMALRLAYPGIPVAGTYFHSDHTPAKNANLILESDEWRWNHTFLEPLITTGSLAQTIVVEYHDDGPGRVLPVLPPYVCHAVCSPQLYHPSERIVGLTPSQRAINRYGPF